MDRRTLLRAGSGTLLLGGLGALGVGIATAGDFETEFTLRDRRSGGDEHVDVTCGTTTTVEGRIVGDACDTAELADATKDDWTIHLAIETREATDEHCHHGHVSIGYRVTVTDLSRTPDGIVLSHDGTVVRRVQCDDQDRTRTPDPETGRKTEFGVGEDRETPEFEFDIEETPEVDMDEDRETPEFQFDIGETPEFDIPDGE